MLPVLPEAQLPELPRLAPGFLGGRADITAALALAPGNGLAKISAHPTLSSCAHLVGLQPKKL